MILQTMADFDTYSWIIALGIIFGLGLMLNVLLKGNLETFFLIVLALNGIMVIAEMLPEWTIILNIIVNVGVLINHLKGDNRNG